MPKAALVLVERLVQFGGDHVFYADQAGTGLGAIVEEALSNVFGQMAAVMVGLDDALRIGCIDVESIEVGADAFDGCKVLLRAALAIFTFLLLGTAAIQPGSMLRLSRESWI